MSEHTAPKQDQLQEAPSPERLGGEEGLRAALEGVRKSFFRELEGRGFGGDEEIPSTEVGQALDAVIEQACIDESKQSNEQLRAALRGLARWRWTPEGLHPDEELDRPGALVEVEDLLAILDANPPPPLEHPKEETPRCNCGRNVEGDWHKTSCPLSRQPDEGSAPEHSKGGLEDSGRYVSPDLRMVVRQAKDSALWSDSASPKDLRQALYDLHGAVLLAAEVDSPQPNQGSDQPKPIAVPPADFVLRAKADQPKDCGGSGRITEKRRAPVTEEWFRADEGPCLGCNHPDCPNRDQGKGGE